MSASPQTPPDALLLLAPGCPHCPTVLQGLGELVKQGLLGRLEVVNIAAHPERAEQLQVRSVPWVKLGPFELEGLRSPAELRSWAQRADSMTGLAKYYEELFKTGKLDKVSELIRKNSDSLEALFMLASDKDTELTVRIGISAILEELEGSDLLNEHFDSLLALSENEDPRVRSDACHFLGLTRNPKAVTHLESLAKDRERAVADVAKDALEELENILKKGTAE